MEIIVEQVTNDANVDAITRIRQQVFEREMGIRLAPVGSWENGYATYLLARVGPDREAVGSLCVIDTSHDHQLHESFGLKFAPQARVARFTHLAVLKPYRGLNIPLAMMLEAHRRVLAPQRFDHTWLLFDVERAANSFLSRLLGFVPQSETFVSEYGCRCPLVRDEHSLHTRQAVGLAEAHLRQLQSMPANAGLARSHVSA